MTRGYEHLEAFLKLGKNLYQTSKLSVSNETSKLIALVLAGYISISFEASKTFGNDDGKMLSSDCGVLASDKLLSSNRWIYMEFGVASCFEAREERRSSA